MHMKMVLVSLLSLTFTSVNAQVVGAPLSATKAVVRDSVYDNMLAEALAATPAPKDALAVSDRLYAYTRRQIRSGADIADCIVKNDKRCLRVTPQEYLRTFNATHPTLQFKNVADLAAWLRQLVIVSCPKVKVRLAAIALPSRKLELRLWARMLRDGELCLVDTNDNRIAMSMSCGNPLPDVLGSKFPKPKDAPKPPIDSTPKVSPPAPVAPPIDTSNKKAPPSVRSVALSVTPLSAKLYVGDTLRATAKVAVMPDSLSREVSWRSLDPSIATVDGSGFIKAVKPGDVSIVVKALADTTRFAVISIVVAKKGHKGLYIGAGVVGAVLTYFCITDWCKSTTTTRIVYQNGGPVNPPNMRIPDFHLAPTAYRRIP